MKSNFVATLGGIVACMIWSCAVFIAGSLSTDLGSMRALGWEFLIAGSLGLGFALIRKKASEFKQQSARYYLCCGVLWLSNSVLFWLGIGLTDSKEHLIVTGLINYLWPILTLIGAILIFKHKVNWLLLPTGFLCVLAGIGLGKIGISNFTVSEIALALRSGFTSNALAYLLVFLGAVSWALYSNFARVLSKPDAIGGVPFFMLIGAPFALLAGRFQNPSPNWNTESIVALLSWSICAALAYPLWEIGVRRGSIVILSLASFFIPFFSTIFTALYGDIPLSNMILMSGLLVALGAILCKRGVTEAKQGTFKVTP